MEPVEIEGKNTEEAIEKAKQHFGVSLDKLDIEILSTASTGIFGLVGSRKSRIRVSLATDKKAAPAKDKGRTTEAKPAAARAARTDDVPDKGRARPGRNEPPAPRPVRPEAAPANNPASPATDNPAPVEAPASNRAPVEVPEVVAEAPRETFAEKPSPEGAVHPVVDAELSDRAVELLEGLIGRMGIEAHLEGRVDEDRLVVNIEGEKAGLLIGRRGQTLDALQYILNKMINKAEKRPVRVVLDAEDYRGRRRQSLEELAARMGEKAHRTGKPITISPMNAHDRRIVHLALKDDARVRTASRGEGEMKKIIIFPADKKN